MSFLLRYLLLNFSSKTMWLVKTFVTILNVCKNMRSSGQYSRNIQSNFLKSIEYHFPVFTDRYIWYLFSMLRTNSIVSSWVEESFSLVFFFFPRQMRTEKSAIVVQSQNLNPSFTFNLLFFWFVDGILELTIGNWNYNVVNEK